MQEQKSRGHLNRFIKGIFLMSSTLHDRRSEETSPRMNAPQHNKGCMQHTHARHTLSEGS